MGDQLEKPQVCPHTNCVLWEQGREEDSCDDCVDGRDITLVSEYASTCDGCGELTHHEEMIMDPKTQLGYCAKCAKEMGLEQPSDDY